jgi:hypothetical protein
VAIWIKALAAVAPLFLGALVGIGWSNSHTMAVTMTRIENNEKQIDHLRELVEARLVCPPVAPR